MKSNHTRSNPSALACFDSLKTAFVALPLLLAAPNLSAQTQDTAGWSPVGATWIYREDAQSAAPFLKYQYSKDTIIQNRIVKQIDVYAFELMGGSAQYRTLDQYRTSKYLYNQHDTVYILEQDTFRMLYAFNAQVGDSWAISKMHEYVGNPDTLPPTDTVHVVQLSSLTVNNLQFQTISLDTTQFWHIGTQLIKNIGSTQAFNPLPVPYFDTTIVCWQGSYMYYLVCYSDSTRGVVPFSYSVDYCQKLMTNANIYLGVESQKASADFTVQYAPNPTRALLTISIQRPDNVVEKQVLFIYNLSGQLLQSVYLQQHTTTLNIESLPAGAYIGVVQNALGTKSFQFVKE